MIRDPRYLKDFHDGEKGNSRRDEIDLRRFSEQF